ncbi:MAG: GTP-binding protein [Promethearchaeota archaeon]
MVEEYDYLFKTIVVGDGGVGKTALTIRFSKDFFTEDYKMTIGVDFHVKTIEIDSHEGPLRCKLQIWDTGGQERFSSIRPMYYRGSLGALVIFDLTNYESFEHLPMWIEEIRDNIKNEIPLLLVGNKSDLIDQRAVSPEEISEFTKNFNLYYMESSAKTGEGVGDCFSVLACLMIGEDVPNELLTQHILYSPGHVEIFDSFSKPRPSIQEQPSSTLSEPIFEPEIDLSAPPVPEPVFEPEPEIDFNAPPVPEPALQSTPDTHPSFEPEPEIDFEAPPVPERDSSRVTQSSGSPIANYKPEAIPFSQNAPVSVPPPDGFKPLIDVETAEVSSSPTKTIPFTAVEPPIQSDSLIDYMPETIISKKDRKELEKQKKLEEKERKEQEARKEKERKEQEKKKRFEEREKKIREAKEERERKIREAREERERKIKEIEEAKKAKKAIKQQKKKEKAEETNKNIADVFQPGIPIIRPTQNNIFQQPTPPSMYEPEEPSLVEALTSKKKPEPQKPISLFTPFTPTPESEEHSNLKIIPNIADYEKDQNSFMASLPVEPTGKKKNKKKKVICNNCGASLSSDYAFCNKCGSPL